LRQALRCELVPEPLYEFIPQDRHCLCGVDIPSTLARAGLECKQDECGDWHVSELDLNGG